MRHAFTLMELMVSIVLIALITLFLFGAIASSKLSNDTLLKHSSYENERMELFELIYKDIMESLSLKSVETKDKHFNMIQMQTQNSLYSIAAPYVTYFVNAKTNVLTRLESAQQIALPIKYEDENLVHSNALLNKVKAFNFYSSFAENNSSENNVTQESNITTTGLIKNLIYIDAEPLQEPLLIELAN